MRRPLVLIIPITLLVAWSGCGLLGSGQVPTPTVTTEKIASPTITSTPVAEKGGERTYVVQENDTLWIIAEKVYGDGSLYMKIYEANTDQLDDPEDILDVGMVLKIPD